VRRFKGFTQRRKDCKDTKILIRVSLKDLLFFALVYLNLKNLNKEKTHRLIMLFSLLLSVFIYVDCKYIPKKSRTELIKKKNIYENRTRRGSVSNTYEIETYKSKLDVTKDIYDNTNENDSINIFYSIITHSIQQIVIPNEEEEKIFQNNYLNVYAGIFYLWPLVIGAIIAQFVYNKLPYEESKGNITYLIFIATLVAFFFHLSV
jgi:hypothetical protein